MPKRVVLIVGAALVVVGAAVGGWLLLANREDPNVRRGKELLSIDEYGSAAQELKIYLKRSNDSAPSVKALLTYAVAANHGGGENVLRNLLAMQPAVALMAEEAWPEYVDTASKEELRKTIVKVRRGLFEDGIDTKDAEELSAVLLEVARFIVKERGKDAAHDVAAYVLARTGDAGALRQLIEKLKGENTEIVEGLLVQLGATAAPPLKTIASDSQHLGHDKALQILSKVLVAEAAKTVFAAYPRARAFGSDDLPEALRTGPNSRLLAEQHVSGVTRLAVEQAIQLGESTWTERHQLHTTYGSWNGSTEQGVLALSGFDEASGRAFSRIFHFRGIEYRPLKVRRKGQVLAGPEGSSPILRVRVGAGGTVHLTRPEVIAAEIEEVRGEPSLTPGTRVAIQGRHKGTIKSLDESSLVTVKLDEKVGDESELVVMPSVLRALVKKTEQRPGYRDLVGQVQGDALDLRDDLSTVRETLEESEKSE